MYYFRYFSETNATTVLFVIELLLYMNLIKLFQTTRITCFAIFNPSNQTTLTNLDTASFLLELNKIA